MSEGAFRFFNDNFAGLDVVANEAFSSEQTPTFPGLNAFAERRSKVWRSNGYYDLRALDTTIVFRETVGVDLTATVPAVEYNSTASLMAAIKAALEVVGVATYTISQNSALKFVFLSNGFSGSVFQPRWAVSTDMGGVLGFSPTNLTGSLTYTADTLRLHTSEYIQVDFGLSSNPSNFALIVSRNSPMPISPSAVIKLQGNETNDFTTPSFERAIAYDEEVLSILSDTGLHTEPLRYWRIYFEDKANPNGYIEVGFFYLGDFFSPTRGRVQFPFDGDFVDRSETITSESGATFSEVKDKSERFTIQWRGLTKEDKASITEIWNTFGKSRPFFASMDTDVVYSSGANRFLKFVKFATEPRWQLVSPNNFEANMVLLEEI